MDTATFTANNVWMMVCTALVFFMHSGFAFLEIGLTRQKNTINILFKNIFIITVGLLMYFGWGFNLMYPGEFNGWLGFSGFGLDTDPEELRSHMRRANTRTGPTSSFRVCLPLRQVL